MIVPMKKVTLLCLEQDKKSVLEQLQELGVLQLKYAKQPESQDVAEISAQISSIEKALMTLQMEEGKAGAAIQISGKDLTERVLALQEERTELDKLRADLERERELLLPWGEFSPASLQDLRDSGLYPYLCAVRRNDFDSFRENLPENSSVQTVSEDKVNFYVLVVAVLELELAEAVSLPEKTLSGIESELVHARIRRDEITAELCSLKGSAGILQTYLEDAGGKLEFASAEDGMAAQGPLSWIFGYVPVTEEEKLRKCAREHGMALLLEVPAEDDDQVPTCIVKPKFLNIMDPLFDFIGVTPGYRENDVNMFFLIFFPIFFGMIIGDAGYGFLFIAITLPCMMLFWKKKPAVRLPLSLFLLLSIVTVIWGWLNGSWCGINSALLPEFMRGCNFIANPSDSPLAFRFAEWTGLINDQMPNAEKLRIVSENYKDKFVQFLCFAIAGIHLPAARLFRFFGSIRSTWRAFGHLGWALLLFANAIMATNLIVYTSILAVHPMLQSVMIGLYAAGVVLVVATISGSDALNLPFSLIGSFVDVLSYIRLFAVGLAGAFISSKFNEMGVQLMDAFPDALKIAGAAALIFVAVFGNVLNIGLSFLSVLVHAVRLNTLEFSNHVEMQWAGIKFRPFKKSNQVK